MIEQKSLGIIGKVALARNVGISPSLLNPSTGEYIAGSNGTPAILSNIAEAIRLTNLHPEASVVWANPDGAETHRVTVLTEDAVAEGALLDACGLSEMPETLTFAAGPYTFRHFASVAPFDGQRELLPGVQAFGAGTCTPVPGTDFGGHEVLVACRKSIIPLPESIDIALHSNDGAVFNGATVREVGGEFLPFLEVLPPFLANDGEDTAHSEASPGTDTVPEDSAEEVDGDVIGEDAPDSTPTNAPVVLPITPIAKAPKGIGYGTDGPPLTLRKRAEAVRVVAALMAAGEAEAISGCPEHLEIVEKLRSVCEHLPARGDLAFSDFAVLLARGAVVLCPGRDGFGLQEDMLWRPVPQHLLITELVRELARAIELAYPSFRFDAEGIKALKKAVRRYFTISGQRAVVGLVMTHAELHGDVRLFDQGTGLIAFTNGVVTPEDMILQPHRACNHLTRSASVAYVSGASCPEFRSFLLDAFNGDEAAIEFLLKFLGYALLGRPRIKLMVILFGPKHSGKSSLLDILQEIFGSVIITAHRRVIFNIHQGSATDPHTVRIVGSRLAVVNESRQNEKLDDVAIKSMTGGLDRLILRGMYATPIEVIPTWSVLLATNVLPILPENDPALLDRLAFLRIGQGTRPRDPRLQEKLMAEAEGIAALIVEAAHRFLAEGLELPSSLQELRQEVLATGRDPIAAFFDSCFVMDPAFSTSAEQVRNLASVWFPVHGMPIPSAKELGEGVRAHFPPMQVVARKSGGVIVYRGLRVRDGGEDSGRAA